jgi:putative sterol carrier protein
MIVYESLQQVGAAINDAFDPNAAKGDTAVVQFEFTGNEAGTYWLQVIESRCSFGAGNPPGAAAVTIFCSIDDWLCILNGTLNPVTAYTRGRLKLKGNPATALKLQKWFPRPKE